MADLNIAFDAVIKRREGKWVNHPSDPGGETYRGRARKYHPKWPGWKLIDAAKSKPGFPASLETNQELQHLLRESYRTDEWEAIHGEEITSQALANELLDNATLEGPGAAVVFLQFALNALNRGGSLYIDVIVDGGFGGNTLGAMHAYLLRERADDLVKMINILQGMYLFIGKVLVQILKDNPTPVFREKFIRGWLDRVSIE